jgi:hypothetical protein
MRRADAARSAERARPGRCNVASQAVIEISKAHRRPFLAAAGDGRAPCSFENSPAIYGWDPWFANFQSPARDERTVLPSLAGFFHWLTPDPAINGWAIFIASLRDWQMPIAPIVHPKAILHLTWKHKGGFRARSRLAGDEDINTVARQCLHSDEMSSNTRRHTSS